MSLHEGGDVQVLGESRLAEIAQKVLDASEADQTEVFVTGNASHLTRFATNTIHQNVSETDATVRVRSVVEDKTGVASGNELDEAGLRRIISSAETIARFQQANPEFQSLPGPRPVAPVSAFVRFPSTAADVKCKVIHAAKGETYEAAMVVCSGARGRRECDMAQWLHPRDPDAQRTGYVAMTRPRKVLVLAVPEDTRDDLLAELRGPFDV